MKVTSTVTRPSPPAGRTGRVAVLVVLATAASALAASTYVVATGSASVTGAPTSAAPAGLAPARAASAPEARAGAVSGGSATPVAAAGPGGCDAGETVSAPIADDAHLRPPSPPVPPRPAGALEVPAGTSLQAAIDRAPDGAVLALERGEYPGGVQIGRPLTLWGPPEAVIRSNGTGHTVEVRSSRVQLLGFSVRGSGSRFELTDAAVFVQGDDVEVRGVRIAEALFGIVVERSNRARVAGNEILGTDVPELGLRGDGIRLWEVRDSVVEENLVRHSRDLVVWFSPGNLLRGNYAEGGRYGTHFMYSSRNEVRDNVYVGNLVGVFVMYCDDVEVAGNLMARSEPTGGIGLGLKEAGNVRVRDNRFVRDQTGIYVDTSPVRRDHENVVERNAFDFCDAAVVFHRSELRNRFLENDFRGCPTPVRVEGGGDATRVEWRGNHFDDYAGYDLDGDGIGDVPYELRRLSHQVTSVHESLRFFRGTPALSLLDLASRVLPVLAPKTILTDPEPRLRARGEVALVR